MVLRRNAEIAVNLVARPSVELLIPSLTYLNHSNVNEVSYAFSQSSFEPGSNRIDFVSNFFEEDNGAALCGGRRRYSRKKSTTKEAEIQRVP